MADVEAHLPLWDYALGYYAQPGVATTCVQVQDEHNINVCLLIALHWLDQRGWRLSVKADTALQSFIAPWTEQLVQPLRALRRQLKASLGAFTPDEVQEDIRQRIKQAELRAEEKLLREIELWCEARLSGGDLWQALEPLHQAADYLQRQGVSEAQQKILLTSDGAVKP